MSNRNNDKILLRMCLVAEGLIMACLAIIVVLFDGVVPPLPIRILAWVLMAGLLAGIFPIFCLTSGQGD